MRNGCCLLTIFLLGSKVLCLASSMSTLQRSSRLPPRRLQLENEDSLLDSTCDFVDRDRLEQLLNGQNSFLSHLFPSLLEDLEDDNETRRELQTGDDSSAELSRRVTLAVETFSYPPKKMQNIRVRWATSNLVSLRRFVLTRVKIVADKEYMKTTGKRQALFLSNDWTDLPWVQEGFVVERNATVVQTFVQQSKFRVTPVKGKARDQPYRALILGREKVEKSTTLFQKIFFIVDERNTLRHFRRDLKAMEKEQEQRKLKLQQRRRQLLSCPSSSSNSSAVTSCLRQERKLYVAAKSQLQQDLKDQLESTKSTMRELELRRWHWMSGLAASCAASVQQDNSEQLQNCVLSQIPVFYERYLSAYGTDLHSVAVENANYESFLQQLRSTRDSNYDVCCNSSDDDDNNNARVRRLRSLWNKRNPSTVQPPLSSVSTTAQKASQGNFLSSPPLTFYDQASAAEHSRRLQEATSACVFFFDNGSVVGIVEFPRDLYRTLTASARTTASSSSSTNSQDSPDAVVSSVPLADVPPDVYLTKGYDSSVATPQTLNFQKRSSFTIVATQYPLQIDVTALSEDSTTPNSVRRYIRQTNRAGAQFSATVVEGTSEIANEEDDEATVVEVVGVLFSRSDKKKQLFWPVEDFSGYLLEGEDKFLERRVLVHVAHSSNVQFNHVDSRHLQDTDANSTATEFCDEELLEEECVAPARVTLDQGVEEVNALYRTTIAPLLDELAVVEQDRLRAYVIGGADCAARDDPKWNVENLYLCLQDEKSPVIVQAYWLRVRPILNRLAQAQAERQAALVELQRIFIQTIQPECCMDPLDQIPLSSPSLPTAGPTNAATGATANRGPSLSPSHQPSKGPTTAPTNMPQTPTEKPSFFPTPLPGNPTKAPVTLFPTDEPTAVPMSMPQVPTGKPSSLPSPLPGNPTKAPITQFPTHFTMNPSNTPTEKPLSLPPPLGGDPTKAPVALFPTNKPTNVPAQEPTTGKPSMTPSVSPTPAPSDPVPTASPTGKPSLSPTPLPGNPTLAPVTPSPTHGPTVVPTRGPSHEPTKGPSTVPSMAPTFAPTKKPTALPSSGPSVSPTVAPSRRPTHLPSPLPTVAPTFLPSARPTKAPVTAGPSSAPTAAPTVSPTPSPTSSPTSAPSVSPTTTSPSRPPSNSPTHAPTRLPTQSPSRQPSSSPTDAPSSRPTHAPSPTPATVITFDGARYSAGGSPFVKSEVVTETTAFEGVTIDPVGDTIAVLFSTTSPDNGHQIGMFPSFGLILMNRDVSNTDFLVPSVGGQYDLTFDDDVTVVSFDYIGARQDTTQTLGSVLLFDSGMVQIGSTIDFSTTIAEGDYTSATVSLGNVAGVRSMSIQILDTSIVGVDNIRYSKTWTAVLKP